MKIAVYFMFGVISIGVFAIWLFHKDSIESLRFDSNFVLTVKLRSLEIKNNEGDGVLYGDMGRKLLATPYDHCWDDKYETFRRIHNAACCQKPLLIARPLSQKVQ